MRGLKIRRLRKERGWKQQILADKLGLSQNYVSDLENGTRTASMDVYQRMADVFGVPLSYLLEDSDPATDVPDLPDEGLPPSVVAVVRRVGQYLDAERWANIVGYIEAKAEEARAGSTAYAYRVEEGEEGSEEEPSKRTA